MTHPSVPNSAVMRLPVPLSGHIDLRAELSYRLARTLLYFPDAGFHRYILTAQPRAGLPAMPRGYEVRELQDGEWNGLDLGAPPQAIRYRFASGCTGLVALNRKGELAGVMWITTLPFREDEVDICYDVGGTGAWDLGLYIPPAHRGTRAFAALWAGAGAWLDARGLGWSFSRITDYNAASLSAHARMQAQQVGTVWALTMGHWQLTGSTFLPRPRWHRIGADAPVLQLLPPSAAV